MTPLKVNILISFLLLIVFLFLPDDAGAQRRRRGRTPVAAADSLGMDTLSVDTITTDSLLLAPQKKKQPLDAPVIYEASDSIVFTQGGYANLYGDGKVNYQNIELQAAVITMNMDSSTVYARGVQDTLGVATGTPIFKDGETPYESKTMHYNFKSKKGFINNVVTQQGEGYVTSQNAKKGGNDELFMEHGKYTTCDNHEHPHFYLALSKAKVKPKKNVVFGPAHLVIEDVPLPIAIPFGFFPFSSSYSSGFIMPTYGDEMNRGFYLRDGGYYFAVSDKMDLKLLGEIFTKGSWGLSAETRYNRRYKYSGSFSFNYQVTKLGDKGMPDYSVAKDFKFLWSHRQDPKANPNSTFSASVNFSTSSYERTNLDAYYDPNLYAQNTKTSSVSYSRTFPNSGVVLSTTFNIAQSMKDSSIQVTLPDLNVSMPTKFPFRRKKMVGNERWYEKISVRYSGQLSNSINTKDNLLFKSNLIKDWRNGAKHNFTVGATFSMLKYLNISPSVGYNVRWYTNKIERHWDDKSYAEVQDTIYGFNWVHDYNMSVSLTTKLYGFYKPAKAIFGKKSDLFEVRHVFTPTVSFSASPDFGSARYGYWQTYTYTDKNGEVRTKEYSPYSDGMFGVPGRGKSGSVNFSVGNNVEMKVKSDRDSTGYKKVSLIDELGANISYNFAAKEKPWSDLGMNLRLKLSKSYTFNLNTSFATYAYQFDESGNVYVGNRTEWSYGRFGRFQGFGTSYSYTFNNDTWKKWFGPKEDSQKDKNKDDNDSEDEDSDIQKEQGVKKKKVEKAEVDADGYMKFKMPWSFSVSYSFNLRENTFGMDPKKINPKTMRYPYKMVHTLSGNGNIKISNRWNFTFSTSYDFDAHEIAQTTCTVTRDLHCFTMTCSFSPIGRWKSYNFSIRANSSMVADLLKWDKRSSQSNNINWY